MKFFSRTLLLFSCVLAAGLARGELLDRPGGIRIGERMTLRPYVGITLTYDSNCGSGGGESGSDQGDFMWSISPNLGLAYNAETWSLLLNGHYNYHHYMKSENNKYSRHHFGEDLRWNWANSLGCEKGWSLIIGQAYQRITMGDDITYDNGQSYGSDASQFQFMGALQRRFNEHWHGDVNASYYWLDYDSNGQNAYSFYGWQRWRAGLEGGFAPSRWSDILVSGAYQGYSQDNTQSTGLGSNSSGYTLQAGIGSYMTERISYRLLGGWSRFEYADGASSADGFVYSLSANWKIGETWNTMLLASSYYQPSERQLASQSRVDAIGWGVAKQLVNGKLRATFDVRYRRETQDYAGDTYGANYDYVLDIVTGRIGLNYSINRFLGVYANAEYQRSLNSEASARNNAYDYDRWRVSLGVSLSY